MWRAGSDCTFTVYVVLIVSGPLTHGGVKMTPTITGSIGSVASVEAAEGNGHGARSKRPIISASRAMQEILAMLPRFAESSAPIMIRGESGTGKELIARELHNRSPRGEHPFISVNCSAIPHDLLESTLFGHVKGSFTGAIHDGQGLLRAAGNGTIFLDEVGEVPLSTQVKLMRLLQEREVLPVGGTQAIPIECRIVSATNVDLPRRIAEGRFRIDLLYRLMVLDITLPPLRQRQEDIPILVGHFLRKFGGVNPPRIMDAVLDVFVNYHWPGNIRQLENVIQRAVVLDTDDRIDLNDVTNLDIMSVSASMIPPATELISLKEVERRHFIAVFKACKGNRSRTAAVLEISAPTVYARIRKYGIDDMSPFTEQGGLLVIVPSVL